MSNRQKNNPLSVSIFYLSEIAKMRIAEFFIPACLGSVSMKFFEMQSEHAEAHLLGVTQKVLREFKEWMKNKFIIFLSAIMCDI